MEFQPSDAEDEVTTREMRCSKEEVNTVSLLQTSYNVSLLLGLLWSTADLFRAPYRRQYYHSYYRVGIDQNTVRCVSRHGVFTQTVRILNYSSRADVCVTCCDQ